MKIKNELVTIKVGEKQYDFNNLILDEYLKRFAKAQLSKDDIYKAGYDKRLRYCLIKFDIPFENITPSTELHNQDFDICVVYGANIKQIINSEQISIQYKYGTDENFNIWDYERNTATDNYISNYYGRKITAVGFNSWWANDGNLQAKHPVCAVLDTSNYNIYLQENQEFSITRKDIITTDGIFYSNDKNKVSAPAHICPNGIPQIIYQPNMYNQDHTAWNSFYDNGYGVLYSVGLSSYPDYIDKEFIIGEDIEAVVNGTEIDINGLENYFNDNSLFCSENIYASTELYPKKSNYKYVIFKYKVWQYVHSGSYQDYESTITDTGYYYYQAVPIREYGNTNLKIKYERG